MKRGQGVISGYLAERVAQVMGFDTNIDFITASSGLAPAETRPAMERAGCISLQIQSQNSFFVKINTRPEEGTLFDEVGFTIRKCGLEGVSSRARRSKWAWHHSCSGDRITALFPK